MGRILIPHVSSHKKEAILASSLMIFVSLLALPNSYLMKFIIDDVLANKNLSPPLIILLLVEIQIAKLSFSFLTSYVFGILSQETLTNMKKDLFHKILRIPLSFFEKNQTGYLLSRIGEVEGLNFFSPTLWLGCSSDSLNSYFSGHIARTILKDADLVQFPLLK